MKIKIITQNFPPRIGGIQNVMYSLANNFSDLGHDVHVIPDHYYLENNKFKLYFTRLSEIFRGYLEERFHLNALELTSSELKHELEKLKLNEDWVNNFLRTGDLVKFAKATPDVKKSEIFLKKVRDFIIKHKVNLNNQNENKKM